MSVTQVVGRKGGTAPRRPSAVAVALALDALSVALFVSVFAVLASRGPRDTSNEKFFSDPLGAVALLTAAILGVVAKEPGRRGILVIPFMLGALVLTFWLGEILVPH